MSSIAGSDEARSPGDDDDDTKFASRYPLKILVADSNYISRRSLNLMLEHLGYQPEPTEGPHELVRAAKQRSHDLILIDIDNPGMEAIEQAQEIRNAKVDTLMIAVSSFSPGIARLECASAGLNGYLAKPLKADDVKQTLREAYVNSLPGTL